MRLVISAAGIQMGTISTRNSNHEDKLDLYPDVALGRLPCRSTKEVKGVVDKIITYETSADPSWFNKMVLVSGDGFLDQGGTGHLVEHR